MLGGRTLSNIGAALRFGSVFIAIALIVILVMMVVPLPPRLLDVLLTFNISFSLILLLLTIYSRQSLDLSVFPSLLLVVTLFRLSLNVASTRLILLHAYAGEVIKAFGQFVVGGNIVVGFVVFLILVAIQYIVITSGAQRVAEVAARFTLDAMPGKQMAIDADLNAGLITDEEARERRRQIQREADFYGAMDGASKFVKGDAIAGIIIILVNIIGGLSIGLIQKRMSFSQAINTYTILTVGDGLVTQIPALIVSSATGILVTRASSEIDLGYDMARQVLSQPLAMAIVAIALFFFGVFTPLPTIPFVIISFAVGGAAYALWSSVRRIERPVEEEAPPPPAEEGAELMEPDVILVEIGYSLLPLVYEDQGGDLLERIPEIRRRCARELGYRIPLVRITDNPTLSPSSYRISIKGSEVARGELMPNHLFAMNPGGVTEEIGGIETRDPAFGAPALWIPVTERERAEKAGYVVVTPSAVLATHLEEVIKRHAHELIGLQDVQNMLDALRERNPVVVSALIPEIMSVVDVHKVLRGLLEERVSIRNLTTILETLADYGRKATIRRPDGTTIVNTDLLIEFVRQALRREIIEQYKVNGKLHVIMFDPDLENRLKEAVQTTEDGAQFAPEPRLLRRILDEIPKTLEELMAKGIRPVILCSSAIRPHIRRLIAPVLPSIGVLSYEEIDPSVEVETVGVIGASSQA
jgi:flagellar biosynthesis protein FlhA